MKKTLLAVFLCVAMLVSVALPAFGAFDLANINKYSVYVTDEKITVDGNPDDVYYKSTKIQSIVTDDRYYRGKDDNGVSLPDEVKAAAKGEFIAYIVATKDGLYVYAEIDDTTMHPNDPDYDTDPTTGDGFQLYLDWVPDEFACSKDVLPDPNSDVYRQTYGMGSGQYLGWIHIDYDNNVRSAWGFDGFIAQGGETATRIREGEGWACELFIPWREPVEGIDAEGGMSGLIQAKKQFNCNIGFQSCDDSYTKEQAMDPAYDRIRDEVIVEKNTTLLFDQVPDHGLAYWWNYELLSVLQFNYGEGGEDPNPPTSDATVAIVAALVVAGAGLAVLTMKKKEN